MPTHSALAARESPLTPTLAARKVVLVNADAETFHSLEMLHAGCYDVVFVESNEHAYSQVKRVQPNLVILCTRIDDPEGLRVLSMLKLDDDTRRIPVVTYTTEGPRQPGGDSASDTADSEALPFVTPRLLTMN